MGNQSTQKVKWQWLCKYRPWMIKSFFYKIIWTNAYWRNRSNIQVATHSNLIYWFFLLFWVKVWVENEALLEKSKTCSWRKLVSAVTMKIYACLFSVPGLASHRTSIIFTWVMIFSSNKPEIYGIEKVFLYGMDVGSHWRGLYVVSSDSCCSAYSLSSFIVMKKMRFDGK